MRKITEESVRAFENETRFKKSNMKVEIFNDYTLLKLYGNTIAKKDGKTKKVSITMAGWETVTTKERLNGLEGVSIYTKKGVTYLNGKEWDGDWITIDEPKEEDNSLGIMKGFLILGNLISENSSLADKVRYKEKIVFATMKSKIRDWEVPSDWNTISDEVKMERLTKIESV